MNSVLALEEKKHVLGAARGEEEVPGVSNANQKSSKSESCSLLVRVLRRCLWGTLVTMFVPRFRIFQHTNDSPITQSRGVIPHSLGRLAYNSRV